MPYVDGYVIPVTKKNIKTYLQIAKKAGKIWIKHGALEYKECIGEDLKIGNFPSFSKISKAKTGETVVFSYIVFKSRAHRDAVNAKVMKDPSIHKICDPMKMPFDPKRMAYGGFSMAVNL